MTNTMIVIRTIIGIIGNVLSTLMSLSQMPAFIEIYKTKSVEDYTPYRHGLVMMKRSLWILYGLPLISKANILVTTSNGVGLVLEVIYVLVYLIYCTDKKRRNNTFALIINLLGLVVFFYVNSLYGLQSSFSHRHTFIGVACNIVTLIIDVLLAIFLQDIPAWLSLSGLLNAGIWIAYALIGKDDIYILISNVLGFWLCVIELSSRNARARLHSTTPDVDVVVV